jgi:hypothetical protein
MAGVAQTLTPPTIAALAIDLAVFDLDRTLVRGSSLARLAAIDGRGPPRSPQPHPV